jgi:hypothetical protein
MFNFFLRKIHIDTRKTEQIMTFEKDLKYVVKLKKKFHNYHAKSKKVEKTPIFWLFELRSAELKRFKNKNLSLVSEKYSKL